MKKLLLIFLLLFSLNITAQHGNRERIKALKVSFITEKLDLSEKEAQEFWPIYNDFENQISNIRHKEIRALKKEIKENADNMTNEKANTFITKLNDAETRMLKLRLDFTKKLSSIIPAKKIVLLKVAEDDFKRKMFEEYKKKRKGGH
ncbi:sensor of ECF-type sigma factor [uncultured Algibacter sp.]|uniref:sensor of ECF-type sigma factor n=1 Tax=uncultured Algibacter sp. TaxID=298659 RepID=UPI002630BC2A|nr:sensor of ECF-type sigma factor [uncultured Algibacter sp.]